MTATANRYLAIPLLAFAATAATVSAQAGLSGEVYDGQGGPFLSGSVHVADAPIAVPSGRTLTVHAGAVVKFRADTRLDVSGTLIVTGVMTSPAWFTAWADDAAGGDTNGDGPSTGVPGAWKGIRFLAGSGGSSLDYANVRFGGSSGWAQVEIVGSWPSLRHCRIRDGGTDAIDLNNGVFSGFIFDCELSGNAGAAIEGAKISSLPWLQGNTATGNGVNAARVVDGWLGTDATLGSSMGAGGVVVIATNLAVAAPYTLTLGPGVVLKFLPDTELFVSGSLRALGSSQAPVHFTSIADDSAGGDTNANGASAVAAGDWRGIRMLAPAASSALVHATIRYAGAQARPGLGITDGNPVVDTCVIADGAAGGLEIGGASSHPSVSQTAILRNGGAAARLSTLEGLFGFDSNTVAGNSTDAFIVADPVLAADRTLTPAQCSGGALVWTGDFVIPAGRTLTLAPGTVLKAGGPSLFIVDGTLSALGTAASPIAITSLRDDSHGGDTNHDGPSSAVANQWRGIRFGSGSGASRLRHLHVAGTGDTGSFGASTAAFSLFGTSPTFESCSIRSSAMGLRLDDAACNPVVSACSFIDVGLAIEGLHLGAVPGFRGNTASGGYADYVRITSPAMSADAVIRRENSLNDSGTFVVPHGPGSLVVPAGRRLTVGPGVVLKFGVNTELRSEGALDLLGTARDPVVLTSTFDDAYGLDVSGAGPSTGFVYAWSSVSYPAGAASSRIENVLVRYGAGFHCDSPLVSARSLRVEFSQQGIVASVHAGPAANWVAFACATHGISLDGGGFDLVHATSVGNIWGVVLNAGYSGLVRNCISWGNTSSFYGATPGRVLDSDGSPQLAGANGNIHADPLFVDPSPQAGNLRLQSGSPCLNAGHPAAAWMAVRDHDENSRMLDFALTGFMLPDMGAYELGAWTMAVTGQARLGATLTATVSGPAGLSLYGIGPLDGAGLAPPFGFVTAGNFASLTVFPEAVPVGIPVILAIPGDPALVGRELGLQTLTVRLGGPGAGNVTNLFRATIRP